MASKQFTTMLASFCARCSKCPLNVRKSENGIYISEGLPWEKFCERSVAEWTMANSCWRFIPALGYCLWSFSSMHHCTQGFIVSPVLLFLIPLFASYYDWLPTVTVNLCLRLTVSPCHALQHKCMHSGSMSLTAPSIAGGKSCHSITERAWQIAASGLVL